MKLLLATGIVTATLMLGGCVAGTGALGHYDSCALTEPKLVRMIECGKARRQEYCTKVKDCSAEGNLIVQYGDSLVASVKSGGLSEAEARRKWIEFVMSNKRHEANMRMQAAASAPRTCNIIGTSIMCF